MADSQDTDPLPDFETLRKGRNTPRSTIEFCRVAWPIQGPLSTSLFVLDKQWEVDGPSEPYFRRTSSGTTWHPVSQEPVTKPKVSSITVEVRDLEWWQVDWEEYHREDDEAVYGEDEDGYDVLLECCDEKRPPEPPKLVVKASDKPYVTIHDYVSAVHPWLLGLRDNILQAMNAIEGPKPLPSHTQLMVTYGPPDSLSMMERGQWMDHQRGGLKLQARLAPGANASRTE